MLKRDMLRGVVSELQKRTDVRVSATRHLTSQEDCYNAILEIGKRNGAAKEIEVLSKVNRALNEINCDLKKENAELKNELEKAKNKIKVSKRLDILMLILVLTSLGLRLCNL